MSSINSDRVFLIGIGAQRTGSAWLHTQFSMHSEIWMCPIKEYRFFDNINDKDRLLKWVNKRNNRDRIHLKSLIAQKENSEERETYERRVSWLRYAAPKIRQNPSLDTYVETLTEYPDATGIKVVGEVTPSYISLDEEQIKLLRQLPGRVHIVMVLRDPAIRMWSFAKMIAKRKGQADKLYSQIYLQEILQKQHNYSNYAESIIRFRKHFSQDEITLGFYEDIFSSSDNAQIFLSGIYRKIGIDTNNAGSFLNSIRRKFGIGTSTDCFSNLDKIVKTPDLEPLSNLAKEVYRPYYNKTVNDLVSKGIVESVPEAWGTWETGLNNDQGCFNKSPLCLIKLDDFVYGQSENIWRPLLEQLKARDIKPAVGVIGAPSRKGLEEKIDTGEWIKGYKEYIDVFNHGFFHKKREFSRKVSLEQQAAHLQKTQDLIREVFHTETRIFGAPVNSYSTETSSACRRVGITHMFCFDNLDNIKPILLKHRLSCETTKYTDSNGDPVYAEGTTRALTDPNMKSFIRRFNQLLESVKSDQFIVYQVHPRKWTEKGLRIFFSTIDYLTENNCRFISVNEIIRQQEAADQAFLPTTPES